MNKPEADQIAAAVSIVRPRWLTTSLATMLGNLPPKFRDRPARDVHLALLWLAYDPQQDTPRLLREDGPWWNVGGLAGPGTQSTTSQETTWCKFHGRPYRDVCRYCRDEQPPQSAGTPCPPDLRAQIRADIERAQDRPQEMT